MCPERCAAPVFRCLDVPPQSRLAAGFTLIEMVVVMTITGILVAIVAVFIQRPMEGVIATANRAALADAADTAVRRMQRDIRRALPNSVRVQTIGNVSYIEFIPVLSAGRYCAENDCGAAPHFPLDTGSGNAELSFVGPAPAVAAIGAGTEVVIYNLGSGSSLDAYNTNCGSSCNTQKLKAINANSITLMAARTFSYASPANRFFITDAPVSYICNPADGTLRRVSGYAKQKDQPVAVPNNALQPVLASHVSACTINYTQAAIDQYGLLYLSLKLTDHGESVNLTHAIQINNIP